MQDHNESGVAKDTDSEFEAMLTKAMRRVDAPSTLARSLERAVQAERNESPAFRRRRWGVAAPEWMLGWRMWAGTAVAAMLLGGVFAGEQAHQRRKAEQAQQQFETAVNLTSHALDQAREQLEKSGVTLGD